jgi:hypothetical protein
MSTYDAVFVDPNVEIGHQNEHSPVAKRSSDTDLMDVAAIAQGDQSLVVDLIAAHFDLGEQRFPL